MNAESFYLVCFAVGSVMTFVSTLTSGLHLHHGHFHVHGKSVGSKDRGGSFFNISGLMAFLMWFGGTGYLLTHYSPAAVGMVVAAAVSMGLLAAYAVYLFLVRVLLRHEHEMDPAEFEMIGVLGRVNSRVRAGGTGEMIYSQDGTRRTCGVRSENGSAIAKGTEVVVTRFERGLAYVQPFAEDLENSEVWSRLRPH